MTVPFVPDTLYGPNDGKGNFESGATVSTGVGAANAAAQRCPQSCDAYHSRFTAALLTRKEDLREQRPEGDRRRVDGVGIIAEIDFVFVEDLLPALVLEHISQRERIGLQH
tara:strand:- start:1390 stop:1722 length:333 start_codon:yes stop_codon:yes gene_type:complete